MAKLYYIYGDPNNPQQVIAELVKVGGNVKSEITGSEFILYCLNGYVSQLTKDSKEIDLLLSLGKELTIDPENKIFSWNDIETTRGYMLTSDSIIPVPAIDGQSCSCDFATRQIAEAAQALAKISQIRKQGISTYGPIVNQSSLIGIFPKDDGFESLTTKKEDYHLSCLTFKIYEQANLFIFNNKDLLKQLFRGL